jgi:hypothetical protein
MNEQGELQKEQIYQKEPNVGVEPTTLRLRVLRSWRRIGSWLEIPIPTWNWSLVIDFIRSNILLKRQVEEGLRVMPSF